MELPAPIRLLCLRPSGHPEMTFELVVGPPVLIVVRGFGVNVTATTEGGLNLHSLVVVSVAGELEERFQN